MATCLASFFTVFLHVILPDSPKVGSFEIKQPCSHRTEGNPTPYLCLLNGCLGVPVVDTFTLTEICEWMGMNRPLWLSPLTRSLQESVRCEPLSQEVTSVAKSLRESASKRKGCSSSWLGFGPWVQEWHSISQWEHTDKEACSFPDRQETATGEGLSVSPSRACLLWSNFFHKPHQAPSLLHDSACW